MQQRLLRMVQAIMTALQWQLRNEQKQYEVDYDKRHKPNPHSNLDNIFTFIGYRMSCSLPNMPKYSANATYK